MGLSAGGGTEYHQRSRASGDFAELNSERGHGSKKHPLLPDQGRSNQRLVARAADDTIDRYRLCRARGIGPWRAAHPGASQDPPPRPATYIILSPKNPG